MQEDPRIMSLKGDSMKPSSHRRRTVASYGFNIPVPNITATRIW